MNRHDATFSALVERLTAGEITREQAAEEAGVSLNTLKTWLRRSGSLEQLKPHRRNAGAHHFNAERDPQKIAAYTAAVQECLRERNPPSVRSVAAKYADQGVSYPWLLHRVAQVRKGEIELGHYRTTETAE